MRQADIIVPIGTTLDLNGLHLYVRDASQVAGTILNGTVTQVTGSVVVNRQIFYAGSSGYDVGNGTVPFSDDNAIAFDKSAYLAGSGAAETGREVKKG